MGKVENGKSQEENTIKNLNCQVSKEDHDTLKEVAAQLGGMSLSALVRMVMINNKLTRYKETGDPRVFLE